MKASTTLRLAALARRPTDQLRAVILLSALVTMVAALGFSPEVISAEPASTVQRPSFDGSARSGPGTERNTTPTPPAGPTTTVRSGPVDVRVVADPRSGDLRFDPAADTLPASWEPPPAVEVRSDLPYGPDPMHRFDLHLPAGAEAAPVIVHLHSGGWIGGSRSVVPDMVLRFLDHGYAIAAVDYRLAPDSVFPGPVEDVKRAIREIKALGVETGVIDPDRIVVYGTSAGGHLGALAAATVDRFEPSDLSATAASVDSSVAGIVVVVGPTDLVQLYAHPNAWAAPMSGTFMGCFPACTPQQLRPANPAEYLDTEPPPAYWAYGAQDPLVDATAQGVAIARGWADAGAGSWLDLVDDGDHNLDGTLVNQRALEDFVATVTGS